MGQVFPIEAGSVGVVPRKERICKPISGVAEPRPSEHLERFYHHPHLAWAEPGTSISEEWIWMSECKGLELNSTIDLLFALKPHHSLLRVIHSSSK